MATAKQSPVVLDFNGMPVRFVGTSEKPEWVAADVCEVLGIVNSRRALAEFDADEKGVHSMNTLGGNQELVTVYESGLYRLIFASRKPEAKAFKKWVCNEVLPSIRKFGTYPPPEGGAEPQAQLKPWIDRIRETWGPHCRYVRMKHPDMFTVASQIGMDVMKLEDILHEHNMLTRSGDRPDTSVGLRWSRYRAEQGWPESEQTAPLWSPEYGKDVYVKMYPMSELPAFQRWFGATYMAEKYVNYLDNKKEFKPYEPLVRASAADCACLEVTGAHSRLDPVRRDMLAAHGGVYRSPHVVAIESKAKKPRALKGKRKG